MTKSLKKVIDFSLNSRVWPFLLIIAILSAIFLPGIVRVGVVDSYPWVFTEDAVQQIPPFYQFRPMEPALEDDYIYQYYLDCYPLGFKEMYILATKISGDPRPWSKVLPYLLLGAVLIINGATAWRLGGWTMATAVLLTMLSANIYLDRMSGGLPRSFGFFVSSLAFLGLVYGRWPIIFLGVIIGAAFYPAMGFFSGICLSFYLLGEPRVIWKTHRQDLLRRAGIVTLAAISGLILLAPVMMSSSQYGEVITAADVEEFPEIGQGGRYIAEDRGLSPAAAIYRSFDAFVFAVSGSSFRPSERRVFMMQELFGLQFLTPLRLLYLVVAGFAFYGVILRIRRRDRTFLRLFYGLAALIVGISLSVIFSPYFYLPFRYILYGFCPLSLFFLYGGLTALGGKLADLLSKRRPLWTRVLAKPAIGAAILFFLLVGQVDPFVNRVSVGPHLKLFQYLAREAEPGMIAVWPAEKSQFIPYFAFRSILVGFEQHQIFHEDFVREMRRRTETLCYAYAQGNPHALRFLAEHYNVRYVVVKTGHIDPQPHGYQYFVPFDALLYMIYKNGVVRDLPGLIHQMPETIVYADSNFTLVDLNKLLAHPLFNELTGASEELPSPSG